MEEIKRTEIASLGEFGLIERLTGHIQLKNTSTLKGVGDDSAVLDYQGKQTLITKTNRFYPLPSELKKDDFLTILFTPQSNIRELCDYLLRLIKSISILYRKEGEYDDIFNQLYRESIFQSHLKINRLYSLIESGELSVRTDTLKRLITKVLTASNIPFHGEPAIGLHVTCVRFIKETVTGFFIPNRFGG